MTDESVLTEKQLAQVRQVVREEVKIVAEAVAAEIIGNRLEGLPTTNQIAEMFERWLQQMHEMVNGTDTHLRRVESKFDGLTKIERDIGVLTLALNTRNQQLDDMQRNIKDIDDKVDRQGEAQIDLRGKYESLYTMIFGDPETPSVPSLTAQLNERSRRADEQHNETIQLLKETIQPGIESVQRRLVDVEIFIAKQRAWLKRGQDAVKFLAANPKLWTGIILGGGTAAAILVKLLEVLSHWTR